MGLIQDADAVEIRKRLQEVVNPVTIIHFTQELNLEFGAETLQLMKELVPLSDKLSLQVFNFQLDKEKVAQFGVDKVPATVIQTARTSVFGFTACLPGTSFLRYSMLFLRFRRGIRACFSRAGKSSLN